MPTTELTHYMTIGEVATAYGIETWQARRAVDALRVAIPRVAGYRMVPRSLLGRVADELERRGWLTQASAPEVVES